jgi:hypothetical protein
MMRVSAGSQYGSLTMAITLNLSPRSVTLSVLPLYHLPPNPLALNLFTNPVQHLMINKFQLIIKNCCRNQLSKLLKVRNLSGEMFRSGYHLLMFGDGKAFSCIPGIISSFTKHVNRYHGS